MSLIEYELDTCMVKCNKCYGAGYTFSTFSESYSQQTFRKNCKECNGTYKVKEKINFIDIELETKDD